jgi:hypothetical protein
MPDRAADDFATIRSRLEELKKERKEAEENKNTEGKTDEQVHQEIYGDYCNGNSNIHTLGSIVDIDPITGELSSTGEVSSGPFLPKELEEAIATANAAVSLNNVNTGGTLLEPPFYYDELILDEEDNVLDTNYYVKDGIREYYDYVGHVKHLPNRVLP